MARELEGRLRVIDPTVMVAARIDPTGLLRFEVRSTSSAREQCTELVTEYEGKAFEMCETCGSPGRLRAGVIVTVRCDRCAE